MSKIRPLTPQQAAGSLLNRLGRLGRLRQIETNLGARAKRCFLVWTCWDGADGRGDGVEHLVRELEILPTPEVMSMDNVAFSAFGAGVVPVGSVRLKGIHVQHYTYDLLRGALVPDDFCHQTGRMTVLKESEHLVAKTGDDFFYEVREDGRGDCPPQRWRFALANYPERKEDSIEWQVVLVRQSGDRDRKGRLQLGPGGSGEGT